MLSFLCFQVSNPTMFALGQDHLNDVVRFVEYFFLFLRFFVQNLKKRETVNFMHNEFKIK